MIGLLLGLCLMLTLGQAPAPAPNGGAGAGGEQPRYDRRYEISAAHVMNGTNLEQTVYIYDRQTRTVSTRSKSTTSNLWSHPVPEFKVPE